MNISQISLIKKPRDYREVRLRVIAVVEAMIASENKFNYADIGNATGLTVAQVAHQAKSIRSRPDEYPGGWPPDRTASRGRLALLGKSTLREGIVDPTPGEIRDRAQAIRVAKGETWTDERSL